MTISGIYSGQELYKPSSTHQSHQFRKIQTSAPSAGPKTSDTVNISDEAKEISKKAQIDSVHKNIKKENLPVEAFALPEWFIDFIPKESILNHPDIDPKERFSYSGKKKRAISYCSNTAFKCLSEEFQKTGLSTTERYNMKISQPDQFTEYNEKLHQSVKMRLLEDERYVKDMDSLGNTV